MSHSLTPDDMDIADVGSEIKPSVLISKRKKPGGGHLPNHPEWKRGCGWDDISRFWIGSPKADARNIRPLDPEYLAFNQERVSLHMEWCSSLPVEFGMPELEHNRTMSRSLYRWNRAHGAAPAEYQTPPNLRAWCSTRGVDQSSGAMARRWDKAKGEWFQLPCPRSQCEYADSSGPGKGAPCSRRAQLYVVPRWSVLADRVEAGTKHEGFKAFADKIRQFPVAPLKLNTGGEFFPSGVAFQQFINGIEKQVKSILGPKAWPVPLIGLPFTIGVTKHIGKHQYTVYTFQQSGSLPGWIGHVKSELERLRASARILFLGGESEQEQLPATAADDEGDLTPRVISRPALVANLSEPAENVDDGVDTVEGEVVVDREDLPRQSAASGPPEKEDPRSWRQIIAEDYRGLTAEEANEALVAADLKGNNTPIADGTTLEEVREALDQAVQTDRSS